jgi:hypothetical protein
MASVRYVTAFEVASSTTRNMDAAQHILSTDGRMEGVQVGPELVLFGRNGDVSPATPLTYQFNGNSSVQHLLTNLAAGQIYQVESGGTVLAVLTASSQGTIAFTTPAGVNKVTVHGNLALVLATVSLIEGPNSNVTVASLTDANPQANSGNYIATISWGDGSTSQATVAAGTIVPNGQGGYNILASHSYDNEIQAAKFQVQISDGGPAPDSQSAVINVLPLALNLAAPAPAEGQSLGQILVCTFTDPDSNGSAGGYSGRIGWGDGQTSSTPAHNVVIQADATQAGVFDVLARKPTAYAEGGKNLMFSVTVTEPQGASAGQKIPINVADPQLTLTLATPTLGEGQPLSHILVGTFTDDDAKAVATEYTGTVVWGDNETSTRAAGNVFFRPDPKQKGVFDILASKPSAYVEEATGLSFSFMVTDKGGASATQDGTVNVGDAPLRLTLRPPAPVKGKPVASASGPGLLVGTFRDADPQGAAADYSATVSWGDGETSAAVIAPEAEHKGVFDVFANKPDPYVVAARGLTFAVSVNDRGGFSATRDVVINVADAP